MIAFDLAVLMSMDFQEKQKILAEILELMIGKYLLLLIKLSAWRSQLCGLCLRSRPIILCGSWTLIQDHIFLSAVQGMIFIGAPEHFACLWLFRKTSIIFHLWLSFSTSSHRDVQGRISLGLGNLLCNLSEVPWEEMWIRFGGIEMNI